MHVTFELAEQAMAVAIAESKISVRGCVSP